MAVRSKHLLATAFHPELTDDLRWRAHTPMVLADEAALLCCPGLRRCLRCRRF